MPAVKICGLTRIEDVVAARDLGVWALGFVFAPSPRRLEPGAARGLLAAAGLGRGDGAAGRTDGEPLTVGVFTDARVDEIVGVAREVGLDAVQLHGLAGPSARELAEALGGEDRTVLIIRAVPVDADAADTARPRAVVAEEREHADIVLLDTCVASGAGSASGPREGFGGSGTAFRWGLARDVADVAGPARLMVAGGIGPENVLEALSESGAWGVDVSSGVESSPGVKDAESMERLVARVKEGSEK